jgi:hypothetical protein
LIGASVASATAVLVKPGIAVFFLLPLFAALEIVRSGLRAALRKPANYAFAALALMPTGVDR